MKLKNLKDRLNQFHRATCHLFPHVKLEWLTDADGIDGRWLDRDDALFKHRHGIYVFTTQDFDILYVGKAQEDNSDFCGRIWAHVKTPSLDRMNSKTRENMIIYPNNEWKESAAERQNPLIAHGQFMVWALAIEPFHYSALYEIASLLFHKEKDELLPRYNKQLG